MPIKISVKTIPVFEEEFEAALDLQGLLKSGLCIMRAKAKRKVGYHWRREGAWLFSERVLPDPTSFHIVDQYVDVAREVGGLMDRAEFMLHPKPDDVASIRLKLAHKGVEGPFVVMNAGAGWATKRWVPSYFSKTIDAIAERGFATVLVGGKAQGDVSAADEVSAGCNSRPVSLLGQTSVRELVALIGECKAHVGGDTGSTHIAAALDRPAIGLYSITKPLRSCPYGQIDRCLYNADTLAGIEPEEVLEVLFEALK